MNTSISWLVNAMSKHKRFYVLHFGYLYSLPFEGYVQFLRDASVENPEGWDLENPRYEATEVKREPHGRAVFKITDRKPEEFKEKLNYFLQHHDVSPWNKFTKIDQT